MVCCALPLPLLWQKVEVTRHPDCGLRILGVTVDHPYSFVARFFIRILACTIMVVVPALSQPAYLQLALGIGCGGCDMALGASTTLRAEGIISQQQSLIINHRCIPAAHPESILRLVSNSRRFGRRGNVTAARLGIDVDLNNGRTVVITAVRAGLILDWNREHPERRVQADDQIVRVNGVGSRVDDMLVRIRTDEVLELSIVRHIRAADSHLFEHDSASSEGTEGEEEAELVPWSTGTACM